MNAKIVTKFKLFPWLASLLFSSSVEFREDSSGISATAAAAADCDDEI